MRIVVTGALGHIGSRLIRILPDAFAGAELVLLDNLATRRRCSLDDLPAHGRYRLIEADILTADLATIFREARIVIHLAAMTDPAESLRNEALVARVNVAGTERVARACIASGAALLFVSTTSVYGPAGSTVDETCPQAALRPENPYAQSKLEAEQLLGTLGAGEGLRHVTCRFGTIFGASPGMRFHTAINRFCAQAATGAALTVWRTALHQRRPYLELGDAVAALILLARRGSFDGELFNVLTLNATVSRVVEEISRYVPDVRVAQVDSPLMNGYSFDVDGSKIGRIGFECTGTLGAGILQTLQFLRAGMHSGSGEALGSPA